MIVELTSPDNKTYKLNYYEINDFCKMICLNEDNRIAFQEYQKDYTYFEAYFDYVIFELGYKLSNGLIKEGSVFCECNQMYSEEFIKMKSYMPYMARCSDRVLRIHKLNKETPTATIDPNGMAMMAYLEEDSRGTHIATARTILNQILIRNKKICEHWFQNNINPLTELMDLGFIRSSGIEYGEMMLCRKELLSEELEEVIDADKIMNYGFVDSFIAPLKDEYLKMVDKNINNRQR